MNYKINRQTKMLRAAYAVRGRAAALLAAYVAFDPVGAQVEDIENLYEVAGGICAELSDNPSVDWEWLEIYAPIIPPVASNGAKGIRAYIGEIRKAVTRAKRFGLARESVAWLREMVKCLANEI